MKKPSLFQLCKSALYIGLIGYGGPAILAQMKQTFVDEKGWITEEDFLDALGLAQILPGSTGVSVMASLGYRLGSYLGGILLVISYILPATASMILLSWAYFKYQDLSVVKSVIVGLGALIIALLLNATITLSQSVLKSSRKSDLVGLLITVFTFGGIVFYQVNVLYLIILSGIFGIILFFRAGNNENNESSQNISEAHIRVYQQANLWQNTFIILALLFLLGLIFYYSLHALIFTTFLGVGTFAFGGGFASVPLIQHIVVSQLHWLSLAQFKVGVALGQITPGPVFITATFIGYRVAGFWGAIIATFAIFVPSTVAMMSLSRVHEKLKNMRLVHVLIRGILFGFIGLIAAVTVQFAKESLINWQTWLIFSSCALSLLYFKRDTLALIIGTIIFSLLFL